MSEYFWMLNESELECKPLAVCDFEMVAKDFECLLNWDSNNIRFTYFPIIHIIYPIYIYSIVIITGRPALFALFIDINKSFFYTTTRLFRRNVAHEIFTYCFRIYFQFLFRLKVCNGVY